MLIYIQDVYISNTGCQMVLKVNIGDGSCVPFGWKGAYSGPGKFIFAFPAPDKVMLFTDHSVINILKNDTPCESILLDTVLKENWFYDNSPSRKYIVLQYFVIVKTLT